MGSGALKRGDIVLFATGKPRPGVIVQTDAVTTSAEVLVCPFTTTLLDAPLYRPTVQPGAANGLTAPSQIMADKVGPVPQGRIGEIVGRLEDTDIQRLNISLVTILELGG